MAKLKINQSNVNKLTSPSSGQHVYWDTELLGFGVVVGKRLKTYIVQKAINGSRKRITLGNHPILNADIARQKAWKYLYELTEGIENITVPPSSKSIHDIYSTYINDRAGKLSPRTLVNYEDFLQKHLSDWKDIPTSKVTKEMIVERFNLITDTSGKYAANHCLKFLKGLYSYAQIDDDNLKNPVEILSKKRLWHKKMRRTSIIKDVDLSKWYKSVQNIDNDTIKDALIFLLHTGLRKLEAFSLRWDCVDFNDRIFSIPLTKNGNPLTLPMSGFTYALLLNRFNSKKSNLWVFPGKGENGHITDAKKSCLQITRDCGVPFMIHDLRRTFITIADSIVPSQYALKRLVNHSTSGDVTAGYVITDMTRLRCIVQSISQRIQELCNEASSQDSSVINELKDQLAQTSANIAQTLPLRSHFFSSDDVISLLDQRKMQR